MKRFGRETAAENTNQGQNNLDYSIKDENNTEAITIMKCKLKLYSEQYKVNVSYSPTPCRQVSAISFRFY